MAGYTKSMGQVLARMAEVIANTLSAAWTWLIGLTWNPLEWTETTWIVLFGLLAVIALLWLRAAWRRRAQQLAPYTRPELLVTQGEIVPGEGRDQLRLTISNLSPYPVQVLELALHSDAVSQPGWLELTPLLEAGASVTVEEAIAPMRGQRGQLWVYVYAPATPKKLFRHGASYAWESWHARYKISPLGQQIEPARELASTMVKRLREQQWRQAERERQRAEARRRRQEAKLERARRRQEAQERPTAETPSMPEQSASPGATQRPKIDFPDEF